MKCITDKVHDYQYKLQDNSMLPQRSSRRYETYIECGYVRVIRINNNWKVTLHGDTNEFEEILEKMDTLSDVDVNYSFDRRVYKSDKSINNFKQRLLLYGYELQDNIARKLTHEVRFEGNIIIHHYNTELSEMKRLVRMKENHEFDKLKQMFSDNKMINGILTR